MNQKVSTNALAGSHDLVELGKPRHVSRTLKTAKLWLQCMDYIEVFSGHIPVVARLSIFLAGALLVPQGFLPVDFHIPRVNCWTFAGLASRSVNTGQRELLPIFHPNSLD